MAVRSYIIGGLPGGGYLVDTGSRDFMVSAGFLAQEPVATPTGRLKVWSGSTWALKPAKVWNGSAWATKPVKVWNGSAWV